MGGLVYACDGSNYQPGWQTPEGLDHDLNLVIPKPSAFIVRLSHESDPMKVIARNQLQAGQTLGVGVGGYGWTYGNQSADTLVKTWLQMYTDVLNHLPPVLWMDMEGTDRIPDVNWADQAFNIATGLGAKPGIYSGYYWLQEHFGGSQNFAGQPFWNANYNFRPDLAVPTWGGMNLLGHQYTDKPYDVSVFLPEAWGV